MPAVMCPNLPARIATNRLLNAPKNPLGCYELDRFGGDHDKMVDEVFSVYRTHAQLVIPAQ